MKVLEKHAKLFCKLDMVEEPNYLENLVNVVESIQWENMKMDTDTQIMEPKEDINTALRQQIANLKVGGGGGEKSNFFN